MRILVISDTHGNYSRAFKAHTCSDPVDCIIHLGDGSADVELLREVLNVPIINVAGNCDQNSNAPREIIWECEGKRILLTHGDAYQVKSGLKLIVQRAINVGVNAVLFGHTHINITEKHSEILFINPGTLANYGQHHSYAILDITPEGIAVHHFCIN